MSAPSVSVVVMTYNEVVTLESVVRGCVETLATLGVPSEVVIVDDGSTDGSGAVADRLADELPTVRVVHHSENRALGGVYRTGFDEARCDAVTFLPADGQFPPDTITRLHAALASGADLALGYLPDLRRSVVSELLSFCERALYAIVLGPLPKFQGMFMVRTAVLRALPLRSEGRGWAVVMEMVLRVARGPYRTASVPTQLRPRTSGHSKVNNLRTIVENTKQTLALRALLR